ncbi:MAG: alginate export family protein [Bdellovibrionales bacterium]|nr:alginate export family protein [Bdellovibrionales bacterium]
MTKILVLILFLLVFCPKDQSQAAELAPNQLSLKGSARFRYEDTQWYGSPANPNTFARTAFFSFRVRPTISLKVDEALSLVLTPQFAKILGRDYSYTQFDSSGVVAYNEHFHMHEAYGKLQISPNSTLKAGRMIISHGDQLIVAAGEWPLTGRSFDGLNFAMTGDLVDVDIFSLKIESSANAIGTDRDFSGAYTKWKTLPEVKALEVYALYESNMVAGVNESRNLFGTRANLLLAEVVDVGLEAASHAGTGTLGSDSDRHLMVMASAGYTFSELSKLRVGYEYNQAGEGWRDWYALLKGPLGRNEIVGRRNLTAHALRISFEPVETYKVRLDLWKYDRSSSTAPSYRPVDSIAVGTVAGSSSLEIGQAIDISITQKATEKIEYGIGGTLFEQGAYLKDQFGDRQLTDLYLVANILF